MANNKFCTSCKYFERVADNCGRKNGKYGLCKYDLGILSESSQLSAPYLRSVQRQDRSCEMQCCYNTLLVLQTRSAKEGQADR